MNRIIQNHGTAPTGLRAATPLPRAVLYKYDGAVDAGRAFTFGIQAEPDGTFLVSREGDDITFVLLLNSARDVEKMISVLHQDVETAARFTGKATLALRGYLHLTTLPKFKGYKAVHPAAEQAMDERR